MPALRNKILRNASYNVLGALVTLALGLITVPLVISYVGKEYYALLVLAQIIIGGAALLDFGLSTSFVRYIAEYYSRKDYLSLNSVVATGLAANLVLAAAIFCLYTALEPLVFGLLSIRVELRAAAHSVFLLSLSVFCLRLSFGSLIAVANGLQRMEIPIQVGMFTAALGLLGVYLALRQGLGIVGVCVVQLFVTALYHALVVCRTYRLLPQLRELSPRSVQLRMFLVLFRFGIKLQVSRLCELVNSHLDKLLISALLQLEFVTYYDLGCNIVKACRDMLLNIFVPLLPAASEVQALGEEEHLRRLYLTSSRYLLLLTAPLFALLLAEADLIIYVWLGAGFGLAAVVIRVLCFGYLANILTACVSMITQGIGRPELQMKQSLLQLFANGALSVLFIISFGFYGAALGTSLAFIAGAIYFFFLFHRAIKISSRVFFSEVALTPLANALFMALALWGLNALFLSPEHLPRIYGAVIFAGEALLLFAAFYLAMFLQGCLPRLDLATPFRRNFSSPT